MNLMILFLSTSQGLPTWSLSQFILSKLGQITGIRFDTFAANLVLFESHLPFSSLRAVESHNFVLFTATPLAGIVRLFDAQRVLKERYWFAF